MKISKKDNIFFNATVRTRGRRRGWRTVLIFVSAENSLTGGGLEKRWRWWWVESLWGKFYWVDHQSETGTGQNSLFDLCVTLSCATSLHPVSVWRGWCRVSSGTAAQGGTASPVCLYVRVNITDFTNIVFLLSSVLKPFCTLYLRSAPPFFTFTLIIPAPVFVK